ncbi:MAG: potassium channel family protein [Candidatus Acidiferrales bacterium]
MSELRLKIPFLQGTWTSDKGMTLFLGILIVVIFVVFPLAGMGILERFLVDIGFSALLISGALANRQNRVLTGIVIVLTIGVVTLHWITLYLSGKPHPLLDASFVMGLFACFVLIMLMEVFRPGAITLHRVQGAVAGYLSFGITWGYAYYIAGLLSPGALRFNSPPTPNEIPVARYIYFSFMTLTTVGYGDVFPVHPIARTLAVSEALIGQLYPAVLIAGVLGLALQTRIRGES